MLSINNQNNHKMANEALTILKIPEPTKLKISTMTCLCLLNTTINLDILSRFVRVYPKDDEIITSGKGGIVYVEYFLLLPRGQYCGKKAQIKKKELQINDKLRKLMVSDTNNNYESNTLGDNNFKEPDPNKSKKRKKKIIKKRQFENQATLIFHFDNNRYVNIKVFHNGKIQMTGIRSKEEAETIITRLIEIIKETKVYQVNLDDVKDNPSWLVKNQYIYTKIKSNESDRVDENQVMRLIYVDNKLTWVNNNDDHINNLKINDPTIPDETKIEMSNFETVMINSNYSVGFNIDRNKLHMILKRKYNIYATLESTYQAVKSYYFFDSHNQDNNGVCKCTVPCFVIKEQQKGVVPPCSQVTIAVFRTGSVIITGGCTLEQTNVAYNFINNVIRDNYNLIYQNNENENSTLNADSNIPINKLKQLMVERANENRRRSKKKSEKKNLNNENNENKIIPTSGKGSGKRGRKKKNIYINENDIINNPYDNQSLTNPSSIPLKPSKPKLTAEERAQKKQEIQAIKEAKIKARQDKIVAKELKIKQKNDKKLKKIQEQALKLEKKLKNTKDTDIKDTKDTDIKDTKDVKDVKDVKDIKDVKATKATKYKTNNKNQEIIANSKPMQNLDYLLIPA